MHRQPDMYKRWLMQGFEGLFLEKINKKKNAKNKKKTMYRIH